MIIRNKSNYSTKRVKELIKFAGNSFTNNVCVNVRNGSSAYNGRAYQGVPMVSNAPRTAKYLITIRIGAPEKFPIKDFYSNEKYKRLTPVTYETWQECLVSVAAHEFRHIYQFIKNKPKSEIDASRYGFKKLKEFRALQK